MKLRKLTFYTFYLIFSNCAFAQNLSNKDVYTFHDNLIGFENLNINNGKIHTNYDITLKNDHRYLVSSEFFMGNLQYENQDYFDQKLKYDIANNQLVFSPKNETEYIKINLIKENVESFTIHQKKFVLLQDKEFNGYFEEHYVTKDKILYIKHFKESKELLQNTKLYTQYFYKVKYILSYKNNLTEISSKRSLARLFPEFESKIADFYDANENLRKNNELQFMENLMKFINNFS